MNHDDLNVENPAEEIHRLSEERQELSDEQILDELRTLPILPGEESLMADETQPWNNVYLFLALAGQAAVRKLRPALPLLLERASYGDPGETMRGLCHYLERTVEPDWDALTEICIEAANYPQPGARLWAIAELGRLRDERARPVLIEALNDPMQKVSEEAKFSLEMLNSSQK